MECFPVEIHPIYICELQDGTLLITKAPPKYGRLADVFGEVVALAALILFKEVYAGATISHPIVMGQKQLRSREQVLFQVTNRQLIR